MFVAELTLVDVGTEMNCSHSSVYWWAFERVQARLDHGAVLKLATHIPNRADWTFDAAVGANDRGQILVIGLRNYGGPHTLLLTPHGNETQ